MLKRIFAEIPAEKVVGFRKESTGK